MSKLDTPLYYRNTSESYTRSREESKANQVQIVPWADAPAYTAFLVGGNSSLLGNIGFNMPQKHPYLGLYVNEATVSPVGNWNAATDNWQDAMVNISYSMIPKGGQGSQDAPLGEISWKEIGQELSLPKKSFTAGGTQMKDGDIYANPFRLTSSVDFSLSKNAMPLLTAGVWNALCGRVNSTPFQISGSLSFPEECVLFKNPELKESISTEGVKQWSYQYLFEIRTDGSTWNSVFNPDTQEWDDLDPKLYPLADLNPILASVI